jgi:retron-type reverse transcriptase
VKNKKSPDYEGNPETTVDHFLVGQRSEIILKYAKLRLNLTRFKWSQPASQAKAQKAIVAWADELLDNIASGASTWNVRPERLFRNLLEIVPDWAFSPVVASLSLFPNSLAKLPGLDAEAVRDLKSGDAVEAFSEFLALEGVAAHPAIISDIVPLKPEAAAELWATWLIPANDIRLLEFARWTETFQPADAVKACILKRVGLSEETLSKLTQQTRANVTDIDTELPDVAEIGLSASERDFVRKLTAVIAGMCRGHFEAAAWSALVQASRANWEYREAIDEAFTETRWSWAVATTPNAELPRWSGTKPVSVRAFEVLAQGHELAISQLSRMRPDELTEFRKWISYDTDTELVIAAFNAAPLDGEPTSCRQKLRRLLDRFLDDYEGELGTSIALVPRWRKLGAGAWRQSLLDEIADWRESDFETFLFDETVRTVGWKRLSLEIRETLLTRWVELSTDTLYELTAQKMPDILADAIRWAGIWQGIPALVRHSDVESSIALLSKVRAPERLAGLSLCANCIEGGVNHPVVEHFLVRDKKALGELLRDAIKRFYDADLARFDLGTLLQYASRSSALVERIIQTFSPEDISAALVALSRKKGIPSRKRVAFELSKYLGIKYLVVLHYLSTRPLPKAAGTRFDGIYRTWLLPKRRGGNREISAPISYLKAVQRALLDTLLAKVPLHPCATGFRPGYSIKVNANPHVGKPVVVNVDISGFFQNTSLTIVRSAIGKSVPQQMSLSARRLLFDICTRQGGLPTGAPTSPAIANIGLVHFDNAISKACDRHGITYTRYADDLTFSGGDPGKVLPYVEEWLARFGYALDRKKTNFFRRGRRQVVTGLVVNDKVSIPRSMRRKLRAAVHNFNAKGSEVIHWHGKPMSLAELTGRIAFLNSIDRQKGQALLAKLAEKPA